MVSALTIGVVLLQMTFLTISLQVHPSQYYVLSNDSGINGSSPVGNCNVTLQRQSDFIQFTCSQPTSSVLFDGIIPTLTELDGNMWASQLLTLMTQSSAEIGFQFANDYTGVDRVEITMFNCPQWGIGGEIILLNSRMATINITSCDSLVRVCIPCSNCDDTQRRVNMAIHPFIGAQWVHIAEIRFLQESNFGCQPDTTTINIIPTSLPEVARTNTNQCPSCSTSTVLASVISVITTALVTTIIFVLVQIALCKCQCHPQFAASTPEQRAASVNMSKNKELSVCAEVGDDINIAGDVAVASDPDYMEVGPSGGGDGNTIELKLNQAYDTINSGF